ncbi:YafY family protein [Brevibacterium ammoniilyticum]|uniref:YafY family protein n=1 Tax=Brevibacterium ammoniilyticum TaxID=1046555 RepID=A0ABP9U3T7_9MICO
MKAARLVSEIVVLSARTQPITAAALAQRLQVTERTIYRDLAELSRIGVPIVTESGPGGGVSLLGGWTSPLQGLTREELDAVLLGSIAAGDLGLGDAQATAHAKIASAPEADTDFARLIVLDGPDWFTAPEAPEALGTIVTALRTRRGLTFVYARGEATKRRSVIPLGLAVKAGRWYLIAQQPGGLPRTYRVSRIDDIGLRWLRAVRPPDFDLGSYWEQAKRGFDSAIRTIPVTLRLAEAHLPDLSRAIPGPLTAEAIAGSWAVDANGPDGGTIGELFILLESVEVAVAQLLTVPGVEVVSPAEVREKLARRARELLDRNG